MRRNVLFDILGSGATRRFSASMSVLNMASLTMALEKLCSRLWIPSQRTAASLGNVRIQKLGVQFLTSTSARALKSPNVLSSHFVSIVIAHSP